MNPFPDHFLLEQQAKEQDPQSQSQLLFQQTDVTDWPSIRNLFIRGFSHFGRIDHVFANAGIGPRTNFLEERFEEDAGDDGEKLLAPPDLRAVNVNLLGVINTVRLGVYYLRRGNPGLTSASVLRSIVLTASASSFQTFSAADYTVAKHGVLGILRGLVNDLQADSLEAGEGRCPRVRLNAIAPSWTATGLVPRDVLVAMGIEVQQPEVVARSVVMLWNDEKRHGEVVYSWGGRYVEINRREGGLLDGAIRAVPNKILEEEVMARLKR
jgi:NAD(P)-dependent dehydrogenase (short-subunit alcohol dehydrogenase family)